MTRENAINILNDYDINFERNTAEEVAEAHEMAIEALKTQPSECEYCHEDSDGYIKPLEKNCHAYIRFGMHGWVIELQAK